MEQIQHSYCSVAAYSVYVFHGGLFLIYLPVASETMLERWSKNRTTSHNTNSTTHHTSHNTHSNTHTQPTEQHTSHIPHSSTHRSLWTILRKELRMSICCRSALVTVWCSWMVALRLKLTHTPDPDEVILRTVSGSLHISNRP